jgi:IstB-like ATP binding protein
VPIDLRQDWPTALRSRRASTPASRRRGRPRGWLPYLPANGQDLLFQRISELSAQGSRAAVEAFGAGFFDPEYLAGRRERVRQMREQAGVSDDAPDVADLWFIEERTEVTDWFSAHGWEVSRRESRSAALRETKAGLDPRMRFDTWTAQDDLRYDRTLLGDLTSLRFLDAGQSAIILGPVGVGKTHLATALRHMAIRRRHTVQFARSDKLFTRLRAARLDNTVDAEIRGDRRISVEFTKTLNPPPPRWSPWPGVRLRARACRATTMLGRAV